MHLELYLPMLYLIKDSERMEENVILQEAAVENIKVVPLVPDGHATFLRWKS